MITAIDVAIKIMRVTCRLWATRRDIITGASCNSGKILAASASYSMGSLTSLPYADVCVWLHATRSTAVLYTVEYIIIHGFYHVIPNLVVRNKPNLDSFQGKYRRSDAENIGFLCLMVRKKIGLQTDRQTYRQTDRQTDRHGDNISVFFPMRKKALKKVEH